MRAHTLDGALDHVFQVAVGGAQRLAGAGKLQQRVDQVGHLLDGQQDFAVKLIALGFAAIVVAQEFSVGHDRSQAVAQVMRDGTGHPTDGGQAFRFQKLALGFLQAGAHAKKRGGHFGHLVAAPHGDRIVIVALAQGAHAFDQRSQGAGERVGEDVDHDAAEDHGQEPERDQQAIQPPQERGGLVERLEHGQLHDRVLSGRQVHLGGEKAFLPQLDLARLQRIVGREVRMLRQFGLLRGREVLRTRVWP